MGIGDWGLGTGDWGLGTGDWGLDWGLGMSVDYCSPCPPTFKGRFFIFSLKKPIFPFRNLSPRHPSGDARKLANAVACGGKPSFTRCLTASPRLRVNQNAKSKKPTHKSLPPPLPHPQERHSPGYELYHVAFRLHRKESLESEYPDF
ncbi:MAG: hypothetical protein KME21_00040 [Desmonostoc vinosum HA7617-LM4]|nr:hypothetical protein [Desmonostoc vinosum HA7617-LM4]